MATTVGDARRSDVVAMSASHAVATSWPQLGGVLEAARLARRGVGGFGNGGTWGRVSGVDERVGVPQDLPCGVAWCGWRQWRWGTVVGQWSVGVGGACVGLCGCTLVVAQCGGGTCVWQGLYGRL
jgi:hypothetical protein